MESKLTILTTFSPTNIENQQRALKSWLDLGYDVKSINSKSDIYKLKSHFKVEFIETDLIGNEFGKDYVRLNAFTNWIKENESALIINSDIEIAKKLELQPKECEIQIFTRNDYTNLHSDSKPFKSGYDAFYLTPCFCECIPESKLVIGQCHWDYFLPMIAVEYCYTIKSPKKSNIYHKIHNLQYDGAKWKQTARIFANELKMSGNPYHDSAKAHRIITSNIQYY